MITTDFKFSEVHNLAAQIENGIDGVHFKNIFANSNGGVTLIAFKAGQKLDTHTAPADLLIYVVEGEIKFTVGDRPNTVTAGYFLLVGQNEPHSVMANVDSKVMLVKVRR